VSRTTGSHDASKDPQLKGTPVMKLRKTINREHTAAMETDLVPFAPVRAAWETDCQDVEDVEDEVVAVAVDFLVLLNYRHRKRTFCLRQTPTSPRSL
jgi:hypothetical protein